MDEPLILATIARPEGTTGVHTHMRELRRFLVRRGGAVQTVTPHDWARGRPWRTLALYALFSPRIVLERAWGPAHVWWYRTSHEYFLRRALASRLATAGPCTVYAQCPQSARAALAARKGPHQRVVLAVHFRTSHADEWANKGQIRRDGRVFRWIRGTERTVLPQVDAMVFVSSWARDALRSWLPDVDRVPGTVVPNFVSAESLPPAADLDPRRLASTGSLEPVKNHAFLLEVLAAANDLGRHYLLDVYGEGPERDRLVALANRLGVADQVTFHGFCPDVQHRLPGHGAYVHASWSESSSLAIMEAMAVGLPVVSSDSGALSEVFRAPDEGRFWPIDDASSAARVLVGLLDDEDELRRAGRAAVERFRRDYDAVVVVPRLLDLLMGRVTPVAASGLPPAAAGNGSQAPGPAGR